MRGDSALFTVIALWAQELGGGSLCAAFQAVKPLRKVFIDKFIRMFLEQLANLKWHTGKHTYTLILLHRFECLDVKTV